VKGHTWSMFSTNDTRHLQDGVHNKGKVERVQTKAKGCTNQGKGVQIPRNSKASLRELAIVSGSIVSFPCCSIFLRSP
jgi:hypothetical protein